MSLELFGWILLDAGALIVLLAVMFYPVNPDATIDDPAGQHGIEP